jgi:hypothetical protein
VKDVALCLHYNQGELTSSLSPWENESCYRYMGCLICTQTYLSEATMANELSISEVRCQERHDTNHRKDTLGSCFTANRDGSELGWMLYADPPTRRAWLSLLIPLLGAETSRPSSHLPPTTSCYWIGRGCEPEEEDARDATKGPTWHRGD